MVLDKFAEVTVGIENYNRRKVLAGIVMIENCDIATARVISVSTGTKCVNGEHLSCYGAVLNDSHAEIVSRRCLMDFFYAQLELHAQPVPVGQTAAAAAAAATLIAKESIFQRPSGVGADTLYKVRAGIRFHLYINTAPCGDARIFSPHEDDMGVDKHPNRKARGQLRTKIESGEGTIPVKSSDGIQTWDGVMQVGFFFVAVLSIVIVLLLLFSIIFFIYHTQFPALSFPNLFKDCQLNEVSFEIPTFQVKHKLPSDLFHIYELRHKHGH